MRSLALFAALAAVPAFAAAPVSPALSDVDALPEFRVYEDRPLPLPEKWDYARVGNFEILSNTSSRTTKEFAKDLSDFQNMLWIVSPRMMIRAEQPVMVVLAGKNNVFERFAVKSTLSVSGSEAASLVRDNEIASIVVDYQRRVSDQEDYVPAVDNGRGGWFGGFFAPREIHTSEEFFRQYIHLSLSQLNPRPPAWVAEGLANIYSYIDFNKKWIEIGQPRSFMRETYASTGFGSGFDSFPLGSSGYGYSGIGMGSNGFNSYDGSGFYSGSGAYGPGNLGFGNQFQSYSYVRPMTIMPMEKLFAVGYDSPLLKGGEKDQYQTSGWRTQATAFVHMCLYGEKGKYRQAFLKFCARLADEPPSETLFKECFGVSYKEMAFRLRSYTEFTNYTGMIIEANKGTTLYPSDPIKIRPATDAEIGRIKGETYRLAGQEESARREFVVAYLRGERDPQLLASLGLMARQRHDEARARTYLEAVSATGAPVPRPRAYLELSKLRAEAYAAKNGTRPYTTEQVIELLTPLFVAQRQNQQLVAIYLEIARVWENSAVAPDRGNLGALEYGARLFPYHGELLLRTAELLIKHGYKEDAAPLLQRALNTTRDPELKAKLELVQKKIAGTSPAAGGATLRFSPEANLGPELRQRLTEYRAAKAAALTELRAQLASTEKLAPTQREAGVVAFAAQQSPRLRALEGDALRLEEDLGWPPDEGDDYAPGLTDFNPDLSPGARDQLRVLYAALQRPQGLSPPQRSLLREMIMEAQTSAAPRGAFLFFAPATARVRFPADLPAPLTAQIVAFTREKEALKTELRNALTTPGAVDSDPVRTVGLSALADQQAPRFTALGAQADAIRRALEQLPGRPVPSAPALPPALATRLTAYQNQRAELQQNSRRDLRALRSGLPASGVELVSAGDPPRLALQIAGEVTPELAAKRAAVDAFNRDYTSRAAALNRELAELRRLLADAAPPESVHGKSVNDLMQDFTTAALRQASADLYRDCRAAVFQPGLAPEQRRLLLGRTPEKQPSLVFEF